MALTVNTNVASLNAQRNLARSSSDLNVSFQRLSSGLRINSAKDDAAGLAISNGFTAEIQGLAVAERNANDGISVAQTAEGSLDEISNLLLRIRELAVQSSNSSNTSDDRSKIQTEVSELKSEIDRIATTTNFNGSNLLDGSFGTSKFQIGVNSGDTIEMTIGSVKTSDLGSTTATQSGEFKLAKKTSTANSLTTSGTLATLESSQLTINGTAIRAANSGDDTISSSDNAASAIARAAAINASASTTGVRAVANATTVSLGAVTLASSATPSSSGDDFMINGVSITMENMSSITSIIEDINEVSATTGVVASGSAGGLTLTAVDGRNIQLEANDTFGDTTGEFVTFANFSTTAANDDTVSGTITLYSNDDIVIGGTAPDKVGTGLGAQTVNADSAKVLQTTNGTSSFEDLATGDLIINGYSVNMSAITVTSANERSNTDGTASAMHTALMINNTTGLKDEVVADAQTIMNLGKVSAAARDTTFTLDINGTAIQITASEILENDANGFLVGTLNQALTSDSTTNDINGIVASINSAGELILTADDGRNIDVAVSVANSTDFLANINATSTATDVIAKGSVTLTAKAGFSVAPIEGNKQALAGIVSTRGTVSSIDVSTYQGAQDALDALDSALNEVDSLRATLGAKQSRFDSSIRVMQNQSENLSTARSRIRDVDFATETAELSRNQILQQTGISVLSQANANPQQTILALLQ